MTYPVWVESVIGVVKDIQNVENQQRVWIRGEGPECSSFEEAMCNFFDDFDADGLLKHSPTESGLTELQYSKLKEFRNAIRSYSDQTRILLRTKNIRIDHYVLADPQWHQIRALAQDVLDAFK